MEGIYNQDLASIHDAGFTGFAQGAAPGLLKLLRTNGITAGLVVDLGCGSGVWAQELLSAGYQVFGIDISEFMVNIAREKVPGADFRIGNIFEADIPTCQAVTSLGECICYMVSDAGGGEALSPLFERIYRALPPGGLFLFDIAEPGQVQEGTTEYTCSEGAGWFISAEKEEHQGILTRRIVSFRRIGESYRRSGETHRLRLYDPAEIIAALRKAGFQARVSHRYGSYNLPEAHSAFIARK
ncbi:MAG TPA: class I SAM-dependent methyltransferase [bacterium]|nr:class I SAM-dependent methyltransferase [bacterium]